MNTKQDLSDRLALAFHAKKLGLQVARRFHLQKALSIRSELRAR